MKIILSLFLILPGIGSCSDETAYPFKNCGEEFLLQEDDSILLTCSEESDNFLLIKDLEIDETWCCTDCVCDRGEYTKATFVVASGKAQRLVELFLIQEADDVKIDSAVIEINNKNYNFILKSIQPKSVEDKSIKPKFAKLQVRY